MAPCSLARAHGPLSMPEALARMVLTSAAWRDVDHTTPGGCRTPLGIGSTASAIPDLVGACPGSGTHRGLRLVATRPPETFQPIDELDRLAASLLPQAIATIVRGGGQWPHVDLLEPRPRWRLAGESSGSAWAGCLPRGWSLSHQGRRTDAFSLSRHGHCPMPLLRMQLAADAMTA